MPIATMFLNPISRICLSITKLNSTGLLASARTQQRKQQLTVHMTGTCNLEQ